MRGDVPIPGSTRARLLNVAFELFGTQPYETVDVKELSKRAGVTIGALYHHFGSKQGLYDVLRDEMIQRLLDRIEAVTESVPSKQLLAAALLTAYDGVFRIKAGHFIDQGPLDSSGALVQVFSNVARIARLPEPEISGQLLVATLQAALRVGSKSADAQQQARVALVQLVSSNLTSAAQED